MSNRDSNSGPEAGGHGRRRAVTSAGTTSGNAQSGTVQLSSTAENSISTRQRSHTSAVVPVPRITFSEDNEPLAVDLSDYQVPYETPPSHRWSISTNGGRAAPTTFQSTGTGLGINLMDLGHHSPPPYSPALIPNPGDGLQDPMSLDSTPFPNYMSALDTTSQASLQPQSPGFMSPAMTNSPAFSTSSFIGNESFRFGPLSDFDSACYNEGVERPGAPPFSRDSSPRPLLSPINTQVIGPMPSYHGSDAFSGSNPDYDDNNALMPSPLEHPYSSAATSPLWSTSQEAQVSGLSSGYPCLSSDTPMFDASSSSLSLQQMSNEQDQSPANSTPTSLTNIPVFNNPTGHLVPEPTSYWHTRRTSEPNPRPYHLDIPANSTTRLTRSLSRNTGGQDRRRGRSRIREVKRNNAQDGISSGIVVPPRSPRSPMPLGSPTLAPPDRGKRIGPMSARGRQDANNRRNYKDTCIGCKVSKIKTLDYTTLYYITPPRLSSVTPSRVLVPLPPTLNLHMLRSTFGRLLSSSVPFIRVSSSSYPSRHLYDIDLQGSLSYLVNDLPPALISTRPFSYFINNLSSDDSDNCISCLRLCDQPSTSQEILNVLHSWTTQQGCFSYSLVGVNSDSIVQQLDPDTAYDRDVIVCAAQVARIVTRKVEKIGLEQLQRLMPDDKKDTRPTTMQPPEPFHVRLLGQLALASRFRCRLWSLPPHSKPPSSDPWHIHIPPSARTECILANHQLARSLYVLHCWLARFVPSQHSLSLAHPSTEISVFRYAGTGKMVQELMSMGETEEGFLEWWCEGEQKVREAEVDAVMVNGDESDEGSGRGRGLMRENVVTSGSDFFI
ncbi:hypothetical protein LIA77_08829 [Sarocladium implicatum]|nr:hypothetical protein LIA77_08829 [Sarocladium implicatum]